MSNAPLRQGGLRLSMKYFHLFLKS